MSERWPVAATVDDGEEEGRPSDAPGDGLPAGGGAAAYWSPERRERRAEAAADTECDSGDSGALAAAQQPISGKDGEGKTAELLA